MNINEIEQLSDLIEDFKKLSEKHNLTFIEIVEFVKYIEMFDKDDKMEAISFSIENIVTELRNLNANIFNMNLNR